MKIGQTFVKKSNVILGDKYPSSWYVMEYEGRYATGMGIMEFVDDINEATFFDSTCNIKRYNWARYDNKCTVYLLKFTQRRIKVIDKPEIKLHTGGY